MSIVLKTAPEDINGPGISTLPGMTREHQMAHDTLAAHAMQMAIEEAKSLGWSTVTVKWLDERAAANLAKLLGN